MDAVSVAITPQNSTIGRLLIDTGKIGVEDVERIVALQGRKNIRFGQAAIELGLVSNEDILQALSFQFDYPCLAPGEGNFSHELVAAYAPFSPQAESLRALRGQLMLRWFDGAPKALAVLGAEPGEGVSYLAANLAIAFSQLGEAALLIDANLRSPRQHHIFGLGEAAGLSEVLSGRAQLDAYIKRIDALTGLSVLPAGAQPPNPIELLARPAFAQMLEHAYKSWNVVIIDVAPASSGTDFQAVTARCGAALLVARQHHSRFEELIKLRDMTLATGAKVIGGVVNQI